MRDKSHRSLKVEEKIEEKIPQPASDYTEYIGKSIASEIPKDGYLTTMVSYIEMGKNGKRNGIEHIKATIRSIDLESFSREISNCRGSKSETLSVINKYLPANRENLERWVDNTKYLSTGFVSIGRAGFRERKESGEIGFNFLSE